MGYEETLRQYNRWIDGFIQRQKEMYAARKVVRISFGNDVPSFMISDMAMNADGSMNQDLIDIGKGVLKGAIDCGKLPRDKLVYWTAARFLDHGGLLMYAEKDEAIEQFEGNRISMKDLLSRTPTMVEDKEFGSEDLAVRDFWR